MSRVETTRDVATCLAIRKAVFTDEQGVAESDDVDGLDETAVQFLLFENKAAVGTARMLVAGDCGKIGRVAVLKHHRGGGHGAALITAAVAEARHRGLARVKLGSRADTTAFYARLGFRPEGDIFDDVGIPHQMMVLSMTGGSGDVQ
ncbi:MAG: GNAT family N-acetyltransferase [Pseudomonadota bacterium]